MLIPTSASRPALIGASCPSLAGWRHTDGNGVVRHGGEARGSEGNDGSRPAEASSGADAAGRPDDRRDGRSAGVAAGEPAAGARPAGPAAATPATGTAGGDPRGVDDQQRHGNPAGFPTAGEGPGRTGPAPLQHRLSGGVERGLRLLPQCRHREAKDPVVHVPRPAGAGPPGRPDPPGPSAGPAGDPLVRVRLHGAAHLGTCPPPSRVAQPPAGREHRPRSARPARWRGSIPCGPRCRPSSPSW